MRTIRTVLLTFALTVLAIALVASLFLNSVLGAFGLAVTSASTLRGLQATQQVVEKMRERHTLRKTELTQKFAKRTGKRVASTALAAATVGTAAVAVATVGIEVDDYCGEQEALQKEADILYGTETRFDAEQCFRQAMDDAKSILAEVRASVPKAVADAIDESVRYSAEKWAEVKESSLQAMQATRDAASALWEAARSRLAE